MKKVLLSVFALLSAVWVAQAGQRRAVEPALTDAGAPYAPLEVSKKSIGSYGALSHSERDELLSEFKGLVNIGMRTVPYEKWGAKEMADCEPAGKGSGANWTYRCEVITGQGNGFYYFYPNESRNTATLQQLDIRLHAADENLLDDFRRPVQQMFGQASFVEAPSVNAKPSSRVRRWNTTSDLAELFIDRGVRPEGSVRFVWKRAPLVSSNQASLPQE